MTYQLTTLARVCRTIIRNAHQEGLTVNSANVHDLLANNLPSDVSPVDIQAALTVIWMEGGKI